MQGSAWVPAPLLAGDWRLCGLALLLGAMHRAVPPLLAGDWRTFFKGNGANVLKIAPETALKLTLNDVFKVWVARCGAALRWPPRSPERRPVPDAQQEDAWPSLLAVGPLALSCAVVRCATAAGLVRGRAWRCAAP